ncbi:MAG: sigma 54 modulation/S30EA ribosomal C-terminal domain-containing protein, partial [Actinomycetota bacterium]|nr:sigma 54 modulation/S30EA ribosomal C-terminal domain-containing protein [Actinomycetota bacterium]
PSDRAGQAGPDPSAPRIVRRKRFEPQAMVPEDAALRLEALDHDFYVFTNAADGACNVVYRRRDGDLGLIELAE